MYIIKRDGRRVKFNQNKIIDAVLAAFKEVDKDLSDYAYIKAGNIADYIQETAEKADHELTIEEIQNYVEQGLMSTKRKDVARAYITYRNERTRVRQERSDFQHRLMKKLKATDVANQNANVDERSFGGRAGEVNSEVLRQQALDFFLSEKARRNHLENRVYIHDLDHYVLGDHNCLSIPFDKLLANGFNTRQADIRPANSVDTAFQLLAVIFQLQSLQQFGGVSATHLDWTMVPYVRKSYWKHFKTGAKYLCDEADYNFLLNNILDGTVDFSKMPIESYFNSTVGRWEGNAGFVAQTNPAFKRVCQYAFDMTEKETMQAVEGMYHNLNTLQSRSGNQLPFTSINYGTCTLPEGRMVIKCLLEGALKGVGKLHRTAVFPCAIFQCMNGVNRKPGDPNYDLYRLALKCTAQRLYPNYANVDWSGNAGYDINDPRTYFSTMGCRTANGWDINGLGQMKDGRGNICPVTVIMPTLAMEAREKVSAWDYHDDRDTIAEFMSILDEAIHDAKDMLIERFEYICSQSPASAKFMYENELMAGYIPEEGIRSALKHGTLALGQLGLAETLQLLIGKDHTTQEGMELAKEIEALFNKRCAEFKKEYSLNFGVYYTPAENLCHTAMKRFKEKYGEITNVSDKEFFTNSMHVPVWIEMSPFQKIDIESQLTGYSNAGCITYVELDSGVKNNLDALEQLVNYAMDKDIPYFAINVPNDTCLECGYTDEFNGYCPECGSTHIQQLRRVTGYLTGNYTTAFNKGKQQEVALRVKHG